MQEPAEKKGKAICRFNFPLPSMPYTVVLDPLHDEEEKMLGKEELSESCKVCFRSENS